MHSELLLRLSSADAIAGDEGEVRTLIKEALGNFAGEIFFDGLGSMVFHLPPAVKTEHAPKLLFCAHMDEVGFIVRSISPEGMLFLLPVGNVLPKSCDMQAVRVTSEDGGKLFGILNTTRTAQGTIEELYVDLGFDSEEEARAQGVAEGAMVTFATDARILAPERVAGKALDDRAGCTALVEACRTMASDAGRKNDLYFAFTSSEEVGTRGGRTVTELVEPDLIVAIDTANHAELDRGFKNHRQLGEGFMLEHYDKTMSPNRKLLRAARRLFETEGLAFQRDMFGGGGTDAGAAHLTGSGRLALVLGIPLRYCHASCSIADLRDIEGVARAAVALAHRLDRRQVEEYLTWQD